jgi:sorting nexin-8
MPNKSPAYGLKCNYILILILVIIELPRPELGDLSDLAPERTTSPTQLGLRYPDICQFDTIEVDLVPEKKGLFLKHVEYQVSSKVV